MRVAVAMFGLGQCPVVDGWTGDDNYDDEKVGTRGDMVSFDCDIYVYTCKLTALIRHGEFADYRLHEFYVKLI